MGDVFNQGIHQMLSPGVCIMTLKNLNLTFLYLFSNVRIPYVFVVEAVHKQSK